MPPGELRIELRGDGETPPPILVVPHAAARSTAVPDGAVVVSVSAHEVQLKVPGDEQPRAVLDAWTTVGAWRVRCHDPSETSSVLDASGWGVPELRVVHARGGAPGSTCRLALQEDGETVIGRSPECDLTVDDVAVSRRHARVVRRDSRYYLEDLWSKGGTFLGEVRLQEAHLLRHQTRFRVGQTTIEFFSLFDALAEGGEPQSDSAEKLDGELDDEKAEGKAAAPVQADSVSAAPGERKGPVPARRPWWENAILVLLVGALLAGIAWLVMTLQPS